MEFADNNRNTFSLRKVDPLSLSDDDKTIVCDLMSDYGSVSSMLGPIPAMISQVLLKLNPEVLLKSYADYYKEKLTKVPQGEDEVNDMYFITDTIFNQVIGKINVSNYVDDKPSHLSTTPMLEVSLFLTSEYTRRGLATYLVQILLPKIRKYGDAVFCFQTLASNTPVHKLALYVGAKYVHRFEKHVDYGFWKGHDTSDLFLLPSRSGHSAVKLL